MPVVAQNWVSSKLYSAQDAYGQTMSRRKCWSDGIACFDWTANTMAHVHVLAASMQFNRHPAYVECHQRHYCCTAAGRYGVHSTQYEHHGALPTLLMHVHTRTAPPSGIHSKSQTTVTKVCVVCTESCIVFVNSV